MIPEQREENVEKSIFNYLYTNFTFVPLYFEGVPFKEEDHDEWVRVFKFVASRRFDRQVGGGLFGSQINFILNMNISVKQDYLETDPYRMIKIRDPLVDLFKERTCIPIIDYAGGNPNTVIGFMNCFDIDEKNLGLDDQKAMYVYNVSPVLFYEEKRQ